MRLILTILLIHLGMSACMNRGDRFVERKSDVAMKEINYRGGLVRFSIPSHWKEEYGKDGGGVFYGDRDSSGTLRLNVLSFETTGSNRVDVKAQAENTAAKHRGESMVLRDGDAMARYDLHETEDGQAISLRTWAIYSRVDDSHVRIIMFTYTVSSAEFGDEKHVRDIETIDREIRNAQFAKA